MSKVATLSRVGSSPSDVLQDSVVQQAQLKFLSCVDLNERVSHYCQRLAALGAFWRQITALGMAQVQDRQIPRADQGQVVKRVEILLCTLDRVARQLLERSAQVESKRQAVQQLIDNIAVSEHAVEARALELAEDVLECEYRERQQAMHVMAVHSLQQEQGELEKLLVPQVKVLRETMDQLEEKEERLRRVQMLYYAVKEHCKQDLTVLEQQARDSLQEASAWKECRTCDIAQKLEMMNVDSMRQHKAEREVTVLRNQLHHLQKWGGEALQTKLLQCSRSRLIKQRISELQRLLSSPDQVVPPDSELQGFQDPFPASDIFVNDNQRTTDFLLADGAPSLTANQVEEYLSREFGFVVRGDFLMFCRLKEELGNAGLAYLAHKVRDASSLRKDALDPCQTRVFADPTELRRILHVLQDIAFQFRENNSLTESVLDKWNIFLRDNLISTDPQQRCSATPVKRGKGKKSRAKHSPTSTQSTTPPGSKDNVSSRSSISRLKRAFGITHKKSQHAQTA
ncbi:uncharacterized protein LOC112566766 isoform X1 [Pomacea canaliculata]|uniref:uncharacterized protein LOC112566766 isoform X1 n=1 Tax=Pomacea canaliculata TaxID=400727 RepID=UPI000D72DE8C|nr:uncharacterized protein LOC112566766 isoform X1 [Pomacea canaliculata]